MIKSEFGDSLRSKSEVGQFNEVLCKVIAHNLCVLIACIHEIGLDVQQFNGQSALVGQQRVAFGQSLRRTLVCCKAG